MMIQYLFWTGFWTLLCYSVFLLCQYLCYVAFHEEVTAETGVHAITFRTVDFPLEGYVRGIASTIVYRHLDRLDVLIAGDLDEETGKIAKALAKDYPFVRILFRRT